jgi:hypothetical protein
LDVAIEVTRAFEHYFFNFANEFYQIMERNKNVMVPIKGSYGGVNYLENDFFPFDPFLLRQSQQFIQPLYQKWEGSVVNRRKTSNAGIQSPREEYLEDQLDIDYVYSETVGRARNTSINDRAKMFFSGSLNNNGTPARISASLSSNSTKMGSSLMDDDMFSEGDDQDDEDQDVYDFEDGDDISSSDEGEAHYYDDERGDDSMFARAVAIRDGMSRKSVKSSGHLSRSVEDDLFIEIPVPYGWEYHEDVVYTANSTPDLRKKGRK